MTAENREKKTRYDAIIVTYFWTIPVNTHARPTYLNNVKPKIYYLELQLFAYILNKKYLRIKCFLFEIWKFAQTTVTQFVCVITIKQSIPHVYLRHVSNFVAQISIFLPSTAPTLWSCTLFWYIVFENEKKINHLSFFYVHIQILSPFSLWYRTRRRRKDLRGSIEAKSQWLKTKKKQQSRIRVLGA